MSFLLAFLGFAVLIVLHELGHFFAAKAVGMRVERFALFFPPLLARKKRGETEYAIGAIPLGGYVKITGMHPKEEIPPQHAHRAYFRQKVWKRVVVIAAGPAVNLVLAFLILWVLFLANGTREATSDVGEIERGQPAAGVLMPGDRILAVDGESGDRAVLSRQISSHECAGTPTAGCQAATPAVVRFERSGKVLERSIRPVYDAELRRTRLGFAFDFKEEPAGPLRSTGLAAETMWTFTTETVTTIVQLFKAEKREEVSGIVGSYEVTRQSIEVDLTRAMYILAVISLSLGIINLFPFLPLDGGHIFWAVAEKIRGRAIPFRVMERAGFVGFALVLMLFYIGLTNDIERLRGDGFDVR